MEYLLYNCKYDTVLHWLETLLNSNNDEVLKTVFIKLIESNLNFKYNNTKNLVNDYDSEIEITHSYRRLIIKFNIDNGNMWNLSIYTFSYYPKLLFIINKYNIRNEKYNDNYFSKFRKYKKKGN